MSTRKPLSTVLASTFSLALAMVNVSTADGAVLPVDWKKFFHGEPAAPPKAAPPGQLARITTAADVTLDVQVESFLRGLAQAIKARDGTPMLAHLSDQYTIVDLPDRNRAKALFLQAIDQVAGPADIVITGLVVQSGIRIASVEFHYPDKSTKLKTFKFDAAGRLLESDLFGIQVQQHGV